MLVIKLKEVLLSRRAMKPHAHLMKYCGFDRNKATRLLNGELKAINLKDLSAICEMLYCTPNDLFYWKNTPSNRLPANHPCISQLVKPTGHENWDNMFKDLTPDKVSELYQIGEEMGKKKNN